jgi:leader peptidase (prepilin peptidase)/N-methyltransferase
VTDVDRTDDALPGGLRSGVLVDGDGNLLGVEAASSRPEQAPVTDAVVEAVEIPEPEPDVWSEATVGFTSGPLALRALRWIVAIAGGLIAAYAVLLSDPPNLVTHAWIALALFVPVLTLIDAETRYLPNALVYPAGIIVALGALSGVMSTGEWGSLAVALACAVMGLLFYGTIWFLAPAGGLGFGDVRLAFVLGLALGLHGFYLAAAAIVVVAPLISVAFVALIAVRNFLTGRGAPDGVPFGPGMLLSALVLMLAEGHVPVLI